MTNSYKNRLGRQSFRKGLSDKDPNDSNSYMMPNGKIKTPHRPLYARSTAVGMGFGVLNGLTGGLLGLGLSIYNPHRTKKIEAEGIKVNTPKDFQTQSERIQKKINVYGDSYKGSDVHIRDVDSLKSIHAGMSQSMRTSNPGFKDTIKSSEASLKIKGIKGSNESNPRVKPVNKKTSAQKE